MALTNAGVISTPQYSQNVMMLAQQMFSRVRPFVRTDSAKTDRYYFRRYGDAVVSELTERLKVQPLQDTAFSQVAVDIREYFVRQGVDRADLNRTNISDPLSPVTQAQAAAMGRMIDRIILQAAGAAALTGRTGAGTENLALTVADNETGGFAYGTGAQGLQLGKLTVAQRLLGDNGIDPGNQVAVITPRMLQQLIATNEVSSKLYGVSNDQIAALQTNRVGQIAGMNVVVVQPSDAGGNIVPTNGLTAGALRRFCYVFDRNAIGLVVAEDQSNSVVYTNHDLLGSPIAYSTMAMGAVRIDPRAVVQISCTE